jgi:hypothetical protein
VVALISFSCCKDFSICSVHTSLGLLMGPVAAASLGEKREAGSTFKAAGCRAAPCPL